MQEIEDALFQRWCRHGDTQALGELFDAAAPRLLKLAIHLAGDVAEAEDLVQATFLAAIEQRASVDPTRPVMPWLSGVLANKARAHLRFAARGIDAARLSARAVPDAAQPLEHRELDGAVAKAIDRLGEPYRQVLVLRLRHGLGVGDIAHVLERDSGTVRVQLHRGLEKLRELLPAALATSVILGLVTARGLAAVKAQVLREGVAATAITASTLTLGGLIVTKQVLIATALVAVIAVLFLLQRPRHGAAGSPGALRQQTLATPEPDATRSLQPAQAPAGLSSAGVVGRTAVEAQHAYEPVLRGVVVDAETSQPIAGAWLGLFEPRAAYALDLVRERPDLYEIDINGRLRARTRADWPLVVGRFAAARVGREKLLAYDRPREGEEPIDETISGSDGSFALGCGLRGGVIECSSGGYATRWRPVRDLDRATTIALWRAREVSGVVIGPDGKPVSEPLDLVFSAVVDPPEGQPRPWTPGDGDEIREALGAWIARTAGDGRFSVVLGAPRVATVSITTPGWSTTRVSIFELGPDELTIYAMRTPAFHFFDAASGAPIERVRLLGRDQRDQYVSWSGEYLTPNGVLELPGGASYAMSRDDATLAFVAWSDGYAPASLSIPRISTAGTIEVPMEIGSADSLDGVVRRGAEPVAGAEVALIGHSPLQWNVDVDWIVDAVTATSAGRFHLEAPKGSYLLRVRTDDTPFVEFKTYPDMPGIWFQRAIPGHEPYFEQVDVPSAASLDIDLGRSARIEVEIVDTLGVRQVDHLVALRADDGRQSWDYTDEDGLVCFVKLPPGDFKLHTPKVNTRGSFSGGEMREVELDPGETERVRIEIPANTGPRHARVVARDVVDYTSWRARYDADPWQELCADGTVPMDLTTQAYALDIRSPAGRRWHLPIPKDAPDGTVIELDAGIGRYRGELLHADGTPWPGVSVHATEMGDCPQATEARTSCITDERGAFELEGLASCAYRLRFQTQIDRSIWDDWNNALAGVSFAPNAQPSESPDWFTIRISDRDDPVHVRGAVRRANGERLADALLVFECTVPLPDGALSIGGQRSRTHADERGEFDVELPRTPALTVRVYTSWTADGLALTRSVSATEAPIELIVP